MIDLNITTPTRLTYAAPVFAEEGSGTVINRVGGPHRRRSAQWRV
jgi:hypothetical protein